MNQSVVESYIAIARSRHAEAKLSFSAMIYVKHLSNRGRNCSRFATLQRLMVHTWDM